MRLIHSRALSLVTSGTTSAEKAGTAVNDVRKRFEELGARLDALTERVKAVGGGSSAELGQSLDFLREQWDGLREDMEAVEMLGGGPGDDMMVAVERSLVELEQAYTEAEGRCGLRRVERSGRRL